MWRFVFLFFLSNSLCAMLVGNPAQPGLLETGLFRKKPLWIDFRAGYLDDWIYKQSFQDEFKFQNVKSTQTCMKLSTYAALLTVNFKNRFDLYTLIGSSRMQIDKEIFTKRALGWGIGTKLILLKHKHFFLSGDLKYFETNQKPKYFVVEHLPYNIVGNYRLRYKEIQAALGLAYHAWIFAPYIQATYLLAKINPEPAVVSVQFPDDGEVADLETKSTVGEKKWGTALGISLVDCKKATLSFEWRLINQNAINVNGEIRF